MGVFRKTRVNTYGPLEIRNGEILVGGKSLKKALLEKFGNGSLMIRLAVVEILSCEQIPSEGEQREFDERLKKAGYGEKVRKGDRVLCVEMSMESWGGHHPYDANNVSEEPAAWCGSAQLPATVVKKVEGGYLVKYDYLGAMDSVRFVLASRIKKLKAGCVTSTQI